VVSPPTRLFSFHDPIKGHMCPIHFLPRSGLFCAADVSSLSPLKLFSFV